MNQAEVGVVEKKRLFGRRHAKLALLAILVIAIVIAGYFAWKKHSEPKLVNNTSAPSNSSIADNQLKQAKKSISSKNYNQAAQGYILSAAIARNDKNYDKAVSILQTAIKEIPDDQISYTVYDNLYVVAADQHNKTLEVSSLKKAIEIAQRPNSGAPSGQVEFYKDLLSKLQ